MRIFVALVQTMTTYLIAREWPRLLAFDEVASSSTRRGGDQAAHDGAEGPGDRRVAEDQDSGTAGAFEDLADAEERGGTQAGADGDADAAMARRWRLVGRCCWIRWHGSPSWSLRNVDA